MLCCLGTENAYNLLQMLMTGNINKAPAYRYHKEIQMNKLIKTTIGTLLLCLGIQGQASFANTVTSNEASCFAGTNRVFTVTANNVNSCLFAGAGNINGSNQQDAAFIASGWIFVDASDTNGGAHDGWLTGAPSLTDGLAGSFNINASAYASYDKIAIGFKSGEGQANPDWAIFDLADFTLTGTWNISGRQALSHAILYGFGTATPPCTNNCGGGSSGGDGQIPEPASLALIGLGLLAAAGIRKQQR